MNASAVELFDFEDFVHKMDRELLPKVHRHSKVTLENGRQHVFAAPAYFKSFEIQKTYLLFLFDFYLKLLFFTLSIQVGLGGGALLQILLGRGH